MYCAELSSPPEEEAIEIGEPNGEDEGIKEVLGDPYGEIVSELIAHSSPH